MRSLSLLPALFAVGLTILVSLPSSAKEAPSKEQIDKLIEQLGSGNFREREKATKELASIGTPALEALRKASKNDDAEIRKRAEELIPKIVIKTESARLLKPKRVRLVYKETPFSEAFADLQKKSGYNFCLVSLNNEQNKFADRNVTLDTGETSFWHALELFCKEAGVAEVSRQELIQAQQPPAPGAGGGIRRLPPRANFPGLPAYPLSSFYLRDAKPKKLPTDDRQAVRIRALPKSDQFAEAGKGEALLPLEVTPEPRLQWQTFQSIHIERALDDQDQSLAQITPQVEAANVPGVVNAKLANGGLMILQPAVVQPMQPWGGSSSHVPLYLKKGVKKARLLKELKGTITAQLLAETRPFVTADLTAESVGKTFKGEEGGSIKILAVKSGDKQTTIRFDFEQPSTEKIHPVMPQAGGAFGGGMPINPAPAMPPPPPPKPRAAPAVPAVQVPVAPDVQRFVGALCVQDDKGKEVPVRVGSSQFRWVAQPGGAAIQVSTYSLTCAPDKGQGQPAKVVYLGRKRVTIEIPFALTDVPLP